MAVETGGGGVFTPTPIRASKLVPPMPPGFDNLGGTFTPGGFVPHKVPVPLPPDQAPYKPGKAPAQKAALTLPSTGEATITQQAHGAAQTMAIQRMLNSKGAHLAVDGQWGPNTETAYQAFLSHAATATQVNQANDASANPLYNEGPQPLTAHERLLLQQADALRKQGSAEPLQTTFSDVKRFEPRYPGEPVAGYVGETASAHGPGTRGKPYYTDANTHASTRGMVGAAQDQTQFEAMFGKQTEKDIQQTPHLDPTVNAILQGVGGALPGVGLAKAAEAGHLTGHSVLSEVGNDLLWLGPAEAMAPFKITRGIITAARTGEDITKAAKDAVALWRTKRLARIENPIIARDLAGSPDRQSFIAALHDVPKLSGTEQHALVQVADHNAITRAAQTGEKPSVAWGKVNFGKATFHDLNPTREQALGALGQEGAHFQEAPLTQFPNQAAWDHPDALKGAARLSDAGVRVPFISKLHALVFDMPEKVGVQELLGNIKSAGIKQDEITWNRFDTFLSQATSKGQKSITREEALGWLDKNYLQIEENRRFSPGDQYGYNREPNSDATIFGQYTLPGGRDANYQEFTIRLPQDPYGGLYQYTGHFPDANVLAHVRTTDRTVAEDKTLMIEEIQSDWHQAGQKQGYKVPVTEHPDYPAHMERIDQAEKDVTAITSTMRRRIADALMTHPDLPAIPENLHAAFERNAETQLGINATDLNSLRDSTNWMHRVDTWAKEHPTGELRAEVISTPQTQFAAEQATVQLQHDGVPVGRDPLGRDSFHQSRLRTFNGSYGDTSGHATRAADEYARKVNNYIALRPADRASIRSSVEALDHALAEQGHAQYALRQLENNSSHGVAQGPFAKTWHELAFKRMLAEAVDKGYARIAWTTGKTQAERYDLATQYFEHGQKEFVGNDLVAGENAKSALGASHFYDNKLTGFVNKYLKGTGVQSTKEEIGGGPPKWMAYDYTRGHEEMFATREEAIAWATQRDAELRQRPGALPGGDTRIGVKEIIAPDAAASGTVVHSIPITDEVRKFTDQGLVLFQKDPLVKKIAEAQKLAPRMKGAVQLGEKPALHLFAAADVSTVVHELGHVVQQAIPELHGLDPETFARSFERYFMTAKAPTEDLVLPFADIREGMMYVYKSPLKVPGAKLTPKMQAALDAFFKSAEKDHPEIYRSLTKIRFQPGPGPSGEQPVDPALEAAAMQVTQGGMKLEEAAQMFKVDPAALQAHIDQGGHAAEQTRILSNADVGTGSAAEVDARANARRGTQFQEGNTFGEDARNALEEYGALARDVGRTLPKEEWPAWVRNQLRDQGLLTSDGNFNSAKFFVEHPQDQGRPVGPTSRAEADAWIKKIQERNRSPVDPFTNENVPDTFPPEWNFQEGPPEPVDDQSLANTFEPATDKTPEEILRSGMRGVPIRRGAQDIIQSEERGKRAAAFETSFRAGSGIEGFRKALGELGGELPKINYDGFTELTPEALDHLVNVVRDHAHLMPYQKVRLVEALDKATRGVLVTPSEQVLIEHVFGKDTALGLKQITGLPGHIQNLLAEVLNVPRSVMASFDLSAPFRQGLVIATRHPVIFFHNFPAMVKAFGSERTYQAIMDEVKMRPTFPMMHEARLAITDMEDITRREEYFYSGLAEKLTGGWTRKGAEDHLFGRHLTPERSPIRMSGRAYSAFLVKTRADVFDHLIRVAEKQGINVQEEKFLHDLGRFINAATGRGNLSVLQGAAPFLNTVFFSPRLLASRVDLLFSPITYSRAHPFVRRQALISTFQLAGVAATILGLFSLVPGVTINDDPRNADFGKIRIGNTRIDILGGFQQPFRLVSQFLSGTLISSTTGRRIVLGKGGPGAVSRQDIIKRFIEGKLAPVPSVINDWMKKSNFQGQKFSWSQEAYSHMLPLLAQDSADLYSAPEGSGGPNGIAAAIAGYAVGSVGFGLQTYGPKNLAQAPTTKLQSEAKKAGMGAPTKELLLDVKHLANLDSLSQQHTNDPQGRLDAYLKYYAQETGDHQYDKWIGKKLTAAAAQQGAEAIRHALVGPALSQYEQAIKKSLEAQGKKW